MNRNINTYYVYLHKRTDKNKIFYVGISCQKRYKRAFEATYRNEIWKRIVKKSTFTVEIMFDNLSLQEACTKEIELIAQYKRLRDGGTLANITLGGEGHYGIKGKEHPLWGKKGKDAPAFGKKRTIEQRQKMSKAHKGQNLGNKNPIWGTHRSKETKMKISQANTGRKNTEETKAKMRAFPNKNAHLKRKIKNIKTGEIYESLKEAANKNNINISTLCCRLKSKIKDQYDLQYL